MKIITKFWRWWYRHHQPPSHFTKGEALEVAKKHHLESEVLMSLEQGDTPDEALQELDLYPYK